jgi:hypothetical protein
MTPLQHPRLTPKNPLDEQNPLCSGSSETRRLPPSVIVLWATSTSPKPATVRRLSGGGPKNQAEALVHIDV